MEYLIRMWFIGIIINDDNDDGHGNVIIIT